MRRSVSRVGALVAGAAGLLLTACTGAGTSAIDDLPPTSYAAPPSVPARPTDSLLIPLAPTTTLASGDPALAGQVVDPNGATALATPGTVSAEQIIVTNPDGTNNGSGVVTPGALDPAATTTTTTAPEPIAYVNRIGIRTTYELKSGDYLIKVAGVFGLTAEDLEAVNGESGVLQSMNVGERLNIPMGGSGEAAEIAAGIRPSTQPGATPPSTAPAVAAPAPGAPATPTTIPGSTIYTLAAGDQLAVIAQNKGITLDQLLAANNLTRDSLLRVGMQLILPPRA
jgi:LysM repeat protein